MQQDRDKEIKPLLQPIRPLPPLLAPGNNENPVQGQNNEHREQHIVYQPVKLSNIYHSKASSNSCKGQ